ncbi:glycosyltransferase family A protein [Pseudomonas rustica]
MDLYQRAIEQQPELARAYKATLEIALSKLGQNSTKSHNELHDSSPKSLQKHSFARKQSNHNKQHLNDLYAEVSSISATASPDHPPLVSIIITTFNAISFIEESITSALQQTWKNIELIIIDNCSDDGTWPVIERLRSSVGNIKCRRLNTKLGHNFSENYGLTLAQGEYIFFQDGHDLSHPQRVALSMQHLTCPGTVCLRGTLHHVSFPDSTIVATEDSRENHSLSTLSFHREFLDKIGFFNPPLKISSFELHQRVISWFDSSKSTFARLDLPLHYRAVEHSLSCKRSTHLPNISSRKLITPQASLLLDRSQPVVVSLCSIPERAELLRQVLASLAPQVDALHIYLDRYDSVPDFVRNCHPQVTVYLSKDHPGLRDNGKFLAFSALEEDCYYFTADDDIVYPPDYVASMVRRIEDYERQAVIGVHGVLLPEQAEGYFTSFRKVHMFKKELERDALVNNLGTGTVAFHSSLLRGLDLTHFSTPGMADLHLSVFCKQRDIPMIALARPEDWLQELPSPNTSLYNEFRQADDQQSALIRAHKPWGYAAISKAVAGASMRATKPDTGERLQRLIPLLHACLK